MTLSAEPHGLSFCLCSSFSVDKIVFRQLTTRIVCRSHFNDGVGLRTRKHISDHLVMSNRMLRSGYTINPSYILYRNGGPNILTAACAPVGGL